MRVVENRQHLTALHAVAFMSTDLDDVAHHLAGNLTRLRGAHRSDGFQPVRYGRLFARQSPKRCSPFLVQQARCDASFEQPDNIPLKTTVST